MTYNPSIPQPGDNISVSQGDILNNFTAIGALYGSNTPSSGVPGADHVAFNDATSANRGLHKKITFTNISADPSATITYPNSILYTKTFGSSPNYNLELYLSEYRETTGQLINLVPSIKAMGQIQFSGSSGSQSLITTNTLNINVASASYSTNVLTVTFTNTLDYDTYYVFLSYYKSGGGATYFGDPFNIQSQLTTGFSVFGNSNFNIANNVLSFMVI